MRLHPAHAVLVHTLHAHRPDSARAVATHNTLATTSHDHSLVHTNLPPLPSPNAQTNHGCQVMMVASAPSTASAHWGLIAVTAACAAHQFRHLRRPHHRHPHLRPHRLHVSATMRASHRTLHQTGECYLLRTRHSTLCHQLAVCPSLQSFVLWAVYSIAHVDAWVCCPSHKPIHVTRTLSSACK